MPRIVTIVLTKINNINICAINTHLEYQIPSIQKRQLEVLKNIIEKYYQDYQIILTGDFNMEITEDNLKEFIDNILNYNLKRVEVNDKTNADKFPQETAIDHIFIPNSWDIVEKGTKTIDYVTDHKEVYTLVKNK